MSSVSSLCITDPKTSSKALIHCQTRWSCYKTVSYFYIKSLDTRHSRVYKPSGIVAGNQNSHMFEWFRKCEDS